MLAISKRLRYEVLRRDGHACQYCGAQAPEVKLVVDAVVPEALGGSHKDPTNLTTACEACNSGKTSSAPDAPLVAKVGERALEWAQAMRQAQARMLADIEARGRDQDQFEQWWDNWGYGKGDDRQLIPKDPAWQVTVNQLIAAGLPLPAIKDCIDLAMTRRNVKDENKFRYMCGVAWNKVGDMQKVARSIATGEAIGVGTEPESAPYEEGRLSLACELLDEISDEERAHFLEAADMTGWQDEDDEPQTESQHACEAVSSLLNSARCNVDWLVERIGKTFKGLPPEIGEPCLAEMGKDTGIGDPLSKLAWRGVNGLYALEDLIDLPVATAWAGELPEAERLEWLEYARALYPDAQFGDERWLTRAWECAQVIAGGRYYPDMCRARGTHISDCPARGTHHALIAEVECCTPNRAEDHKGHLVCERHLEQLMDGAFLDRNGRTCSATDFTEVPAPKDVWAAT